MVLKLSPFRLLVILVVVLFLAIFFGCLNSKFEEGLDTIPVTYFLSKTLSPTIPITTTPSATTTTPALKNSIKLDKDTGLHIHLDNEFINNTSRNLITHYGSKVNDISHQMVSSNGYRF